MSTCEQCSKAIASLTVEHARNLPSKGGKIQPLVATFNPKEAKSCWICAKFFGWLEIEHQDLAEACRLRLITTEFSFLTFMVIRNSRTGMISFDIELEIRVEGLDRDLDYCSYSVYLIPIQGNILRDLKLF